MKILLSILILTLISPAGAPNAFAQGRASGARAGGTSSTRGGGSVTAARALQIARFIGDQRASTLKDALREFVADVSSRRIVLRQPYQGIVERMIAADFLGDISASTYTASQSCISKDAEVRSAETENGKFGAEVCFNLQLLSRQAPRTEEFVGLGVHEHGRHLGAFVEDHELQAAVAEAWRARGASAVQAFEAPRAAPKQRELLENYATEANAAMEEILEIRGRIGVGEVVKRVETRLLELREEVVTKTTTESFSTAFSAVFSFLLKASVDMSESESRAWNTTRILTRNPEEVAGFDQRKAGELKQLRADLRKYVVDNAGEIVHMKQLAAHALANISNLLEIRMRLEGPARPQISFSQNLVDALFRSVTELNFFGEQFVLHCVETNHAAYTDSASMQSSDARSLSIFPFGNIFSSLATSSYSRVDSHHAYTERSCSAPETRREMADAKVLVDAKFIDLAALDAHILGWVRKSAAFLILQAERPPYPTFRSPIFSQPTGNGFEFLKR